MTTIIGIDPGATGALAWVADGELIHVQDMPTFDKGAIDVYGLAFIMTGPSWGQVERVVVEQVHAMPRQGVSSVFKFGVGYGTILGVLAALERPVTHVTPAVWTRWHKVGSDKNEHRRRCCELWPSQAHLFARVKDDGRADAALIAAWGAGQ